MENQQPINQLTSIWEKSRILIKGLTIGFFILIMLIPISMLSDLVSERQQRQKEVISEISSKWASEQTIVGPILAIPYFIKLADTSKPAFKRNLYILPEKLNIDGKLFPEVRHRSLYDVTLYRSNIQLNGAFDLTYLQKLGIPETNILWHESRLMVGLDDARGLEDEVKLQWDTLTTPLEAGLPENNLIKNGLSTSVAASPSKKIPFSISIKLKGSSFLYFTPVGKTTEVSLSSSWKNPAFDGMYLPSQTAKVTDSGFSAQWKILQVSRSYPQAWKDESQFDIAKSAFGVKLLQPTDSYAKTQRSVKYAILIISLTFTIFFFVEIFQKRLIHPLQYILVGIALCVFYSLLLSISEYTGFNAAYLIATIATVSLISLYVLGIFKKPSIAGGFATALGGLYTYIFVLIQLKDYALLFGSVGLFVILAVIMYFSRKIDWYSPTKTN